MEEIVMLIGLPGQVPSTQYSYLDGDVTLTAREQSTLTWGELDLVIKRIAVFVELVSQISPPTTPPGNPFQYRIDLAGTKIAGKFRAGDLTVDADLSLVTGLFDFKARDEAVVHWSDFFRLFSWLKSFHLIESNV